MSDKNLVVFEVSYENIKKQNYRSFISMIETMREAGSKAHNSLMIMFDGYNDDSRELFEIKEVREYTQGMLALAPELFYYLNDDMAANQIILTNIAQVIADPSARPVNGQILLNIQMPSTEIANIAAKTLHYGMSIGDLDGAKDSIAIFSLLKGD